MCARVGLAILALVIYGSAVLSLHQDRHSRWPVESDFSLAAAVSYSVYGTPLGMANGNVYELFRNVSRQDTDDRIPVQEAMTRAAAGGLPAGDLLTTSADGIGAGYPIFASLAMRLFGPRLSSLTYCFLLLTASSTLVFIFRFRDDRLFMVPLLFFALSLLLLSSVSSNPGVINQSPIGGSRYFSIAGILPALHIFFEVTDRSRRGAKAVISDFILLVLQALVLTFVMLVRGSIGFVLAPIALATLFGIWSNRLRATDLWQILSKVCFPMAAGMVFVTIIAASVPDYVKAGRFQGNVWARAFINLGVHPDWPFGSLRQIYDCTEAVPQGLRRGPDDRNSHCVLWSSYPPALVDKLTAAEVNAHLYDGMHEALLRTAFFNVVQSYPRQVFELYLYYKSALILQTLKSAWQFTSAKTAAIFMLASLQFGVFVAFIAWGAYRGSSEITSKAGIIFALFLFSLFPLYFARSSLSTGIDTIVLMYAMAALVFGVLLQTISMHIFKTSGTDISALLSILARSKRAQVVGVLVICAGVAFANYDHLVPDDMRTLTARAMQNSLLLTLPDVETPRAATNINELSLPISWGPDEWDLIEGLNVREASGREMTPARPILRLVAVGADGRHALGGRFGGLAPGGVYRATTWIKAEPGVRVMIEARDSFEPNTEKPSNYGVAQFNLSTRSVVNSTGDILDSGVETAGDGWEKLWVDLRSRDGQMFVLIGLLEGSNNRHVFRAAGQEVTFGGFEISPPRVVKSLSQVGSPPPRTDIVTKVTNISELPPLPESSSAPWDLIEGLNAEVVQGSAVVSGQRILRLVAVGADGRHALAVRFGDLAPSGIYRAVAWVKASFGGLASSRIYRATAWVKAEPGVRVMIEARDSFDPHTGKPSNYGVARFDLAARSVVNSTGDIIASGVDAAEHDWAKVWVDLRSRDGQIFALIGLLEGRNNRHVFTAAGQSVIFGGFEIAARPFTSRSLDQGTRR